MRRVLSLLLALSSLLLSFWVVLTEPYIIKPAPFKLHEAIHPLYFAGLAILVLSLAILSIKSFESSHFGFSQYLATALLITLYLQLPPLALFEHPISDHILHIVPAFYALKSGDILNMPNNPSPISFAPQFFVYSFMVITSLSRPLENLHRVSLFILPLSITLLIYIFMKRLGADERFAMMASVLNMGLSYVSFMFLRQTYAMPLYIMLFFLIFMRLREKRISYAILAMITALTLIMSDPAHVILTIIPLLTFSAIQTIKTQLIRESEHRRFENPCKLVVFIYVTFLLWTLHRNPYFPVGLYNHVIWMWSVFIKSINELTYPYPESPAYWGERTALTYNAYYMVLYKISLVLRSLSIVMPALLLIYIFLNKRYERLILDPRTLSLMSFFSITTVVLLLRGYALTYTPWAAMLLFYTLNLLSRDKQASRKTLSIFLLFTTLFLLLSVAVAPLRTHIGGGGSRMSTRDLYTLSWLGRYSADIHMISPQWARHLGELIYIETGTHVTISDYLFYRGLTSESIERLAMYDNVIIPLSAVMYLERTDAIYSAQEAFEILAYELSNDHNLIYSTGWPFTTIWIAP